MQWPNNIPLQDSCLSEEDLMNIVGDLCVFLLREMCHVERDFFKPDSDLAMLPKCKHLREWDNRHSNNTY